MISKTLIIAGMHRSGTSLVAHWLHRCGLFIGNRLVPAAIGNTEGHFEDADFLEIHERFLRNHKLPASGFTNKPLSELTESEEQELQSLITAKCSKNIQWAWKEPRTCFFLTTYKKLIPSAFFLVVVRDYNATVNSMLLREYVAHIKKFQEKKGLSKINWVLFKKKSRQGIFKKHANNYLKIWIRYYECILDHILSLPAEKYMLVQYAYLVKDDQNVFKRLKEEWMFSLDYFPFKNVFKKELLSTVENIDQYIRDKNLIVRAKEIEKAIGRFIFHTNSQAIII